LVAEYDRMEENNDRGGFTVKGKTGGNWIFVSEATGDNDRMVEGSH